MACVSEAFLKTWDLLEDKGLASARLSAGAGILSPVHLDQGPRAWSLCDVGCKLRRTRTNLNQHSTGVINHLQHVGILRSVSEWL